MLVCSPATTVLTVCSPAKSPWRNASGAFLRAIRCVGGGFGDGLKGRQGSYNGRKSVKSVNNGALTGFRGGFEGVVCGSLSSNYGEKCLFGGVLECSQGHNNGNLLSRVAKKCLNYALATVRGAILITVLNNFVKALKIQTIIDYVSHCHTIVCQKCDSINRYRIRTYGVLFTRNSKS